MSIVDDVHATYAIVFFFKQKTAYEMRISDWSSDVCSSDLLCRRAKGGHEMSRPATSASRWTLWDWPFLEPEHHELARRTVAWNAASHALHDNVDFTERCRAIVKSLGDAGLLDQVVPQEEIGRAHV